MKRLFSFNRVAALLSLSAFSLFYGCTDSSVEPTSEVGNHSSARLTVEQADALTRNLPAANATNARAKTESLVLDFSGKVTKGPSTGTVLAGQLILDVSDEVEGDPSYSIFRGTLALRDSTKLAVRGVFLATSEVYLFINIGENTIVGQGIKNANGKISGGFAGPVPEDTGTWVAGPPSVVVPIPKDSVVVPIPKDSVKVQPNTQKTFTYDFGTKLPVAPRAFRNNPFSGVLTLVVTFDKAGKVISTVGTTLALKSSYVVSLDGKVGIPTSVIGLRNGESKLLSIGFTFEGSHWRLRLNGEGSLTEGYQGTYQTSVPGLWNPPIGRFTLTPTSTLAAGL